MFSGRVYPGAGVVAFQNERVLMSLILRRNRLRWELPAGMADEDETMEETAIREVEEETSLTVQPIKPIAVCWHYSNELKSGWMGIFFIATAVSSEDNIPFNKRIANINFAELQRLEKEDGVPHKTKGKEDILATGYLDWQKISPSRIHPLHYILLKKYTKYR